MKNFVNTKVQTGTIEAEVLNWAFGVARDYWINHKDTEHKGIDEIDFTEGGYIYLLEDKEVIEDIIYRATDLLQDAAYSAIDEKKAKSEIRAGKRVAEKLRGLI